MCVCVASVGGVTSHLISSEGLVPACTRVSACVSHCFAVGAQFADAPTGPEAEELNWCNFLSPVVRRSVSSMHVALF